MVSTSSCPATLAQHGALPGRPADVDEPVLLRGRRRDGESGYRFLLESARWADQQGFEAVWTPERHFHEFGGAYPNPSVIGAALAASTERIAIRAGSVVAPLHQPPRIAEEWAVVDNLSGGRVGISFAPGWQPDDFVEPGAYAGAREVAPGDGRDHIVVAWRAPSLPGPDGDRSMYAPCATDQPSCPSG
ncbi:MAG: LLM class flavin-dependent oxidoreductase [Ilumatobacteraceae bacterium]